MSGSIHLALYNASGQNNIYRKVDYGVGLTSIEAQLKSPKQVVGVWVCRTENGNDFWDEYTGNSSYTLTEDPDGFDVKPHDSGGQSATRSKPYLNDGSTESIRTIDSKLAESVIGGNASWDVLDDGTGNAYTSAVDAAKLYLKTNYGAPY